MCAVGGVLFGALVQLVLAVLFFVWAQSSPYNALAFNITGGILAPVGVGMLLFAFSMWRRMARMEHLRATGIPGQAQIISARQTSMLVNHQPLVELQLTITTAMHAPYTVTCKQVVPMIAVGRLTSGQPLPVKVDQNSPDKFVILWDAPMNVGPQPTGPHAGYGQAGYGQAGYGQAGAPPGGGGPHGPMQSH